MTDELARIDETQRLADAMFDRRIDAHSMQRLESLIVNDLACLQAYVERIDFHGGLIDRSIEAPNSKSTASLRQLVQFSLSPQLSLSPQQSRSWGWKILAATSVALLLVAVSWLAISSHSHSASIGSIANLTEDVRSGTSTMELGQIVRGGGTIELTEGIVSLQLPNVMVDIIAPANIRFNTSSGLDLISGSVHAYVSPGGEGFTVRTSDSVVIDRGTEFLVEHSSDKGTEVSVRRGRVQAELRDQSGTSTKQLDITTKRSARFSQREGSVREVNFRPDLFHQVDKSRGTIKAIDGTLRTTTQSHSSLAAGKLQTRNHILVLPEQQQVVLQEDLILIGLSGPVSIPAGSTVSSYLIHYDPDKATNKAPRGAVTFDGKIAAILVSADQLAKTDPAFGSPNVTYEATKIRELELDEDEIRLSDDRKTASFYFGVTGAEPLDEARILVISDAP